MDEQKEKNQGFVDDLMTQTLLDLKEKEKNKPAEEKIVFDELQLYFGEPYQVNEWITVYQPSIYDMMKFGEARTYGSIAPFLYNPTTYRLQLWDMGIDWNEISEYQLFTMLAKTLRPEDTKLIFHDFDFQTIEPYVKKDTEEIVFLDKDKNIIIDESAYRHIAAYLRKMFGQNPKVEKAKNRATKEAIIDEDRMNQMVKKDKKESNSVLLPLISSLVNHPGFKYNLYELKDLGIYAFMDSVRRLQIYEQSIALLRGSMSGMMDTSKIDKEQFNWLRDLSSLS